jgi:hypothetical protein
MQRIGLDELIGARMGLGLDVHRRDMEPRALIPLTRSTGASEEIKQPGGPLY